MNKRAQFFLLAAVIISAIVISLGMTTNRATVDEEPDDFYGFDYEVKKEIGMILDYKVYTDFDTDVDLAGFVESLAYEIREKSPGSDFIFIYGNEDNMTLKNYGSENIYMDGMEVERRIGVTNRICLEQLCQSINENITDFKDVTVSPDLTREESNDILIEIGGNEYRFPLTEHHQVIFVAQRDSKGNRYIVVE
jgi:hypothetical protein